MSGYWQALRSRVTAGCAPFRGAFRVLGVLLVVALVAPALVGIVVTASGKVTTRVFREAACAGSGGVYRSDSATCQRVPQ